MKLKNGARNDLLIVGLRLSKRVRLHPPRPAGMYRNIGTCLQPFVPMVAREKTDPDIAL
jgi:hypothetical protein